MICKSFPFRVSWRPPNNWLSATWPFDPSTLYPFTRGPLIFDHSSVCTVRSIYVDPSPPIFSLFKKYCLFMRNTVLVFFYSFCCYGPSVIQPPFMFSTRKHEHGWESAAPESNAARRSCPCVGVASELLFFFFFFTPTRLDLHRPELIRPKTSCIGRQPKRPKQSKQAEISLESGQNS